MKVLLINPPYFNSKYKFIGLVAPPLGIAYIAAVLEENSIDVKIIDAAALEMSWETLETEIKRISPDLVAITALTPTIDKALQTAELAKKTCPQATVVMGGYHPTFNYQEMLEKDYVDIVVHVFYKDAREYYGLDNLWGDAPYETIEDTPKGIKITKSKD